MSDLIPTPEPENPDPTTRCGGRRPSFCYAPPMMSDAEEWLFLLLGLAAFVLLLNFDFRLGIAYGCHFIGRCIQNKPLRELRAHNAKTVPTKGGEKKL